MLKVTLRTAGALLLLLAVTLAWNARATVLMTSTLAHSVVGQIPTGVEEVACDAADELCEQGKTLTCTPSPAQGKDPVCECSNVVCADNPAAIGRCPNNAICCPRGTCCRCAIGGFKCCMM